MPTRRIFILALLVSVGTNLVIGGVLRPMLARHGSDSGLQGEVAKGVLLAA